MGKKWEKGSVNKGRKKKGKGKTTPRRRDKLGVLGGEKKTTHRGDCSTKEQRRGSKKGPDGKKNKALHT